ncbi:hypothetical protein [Deinococcus knuensis]|uniref:Uncharacterized protein n=1 Tax=Deinococcus knuensis TaxID=1837380 RepID=A0ABQ2SFB4_9DEIO|nr:hypothetical protein [Deinococcus knuensis]GGS25484.1 hypothetical protein GCM10008961_16180 [Deinococcus knuensis]
MNREADRTGWAAQAELEVLGRVQLRVGGVAVRNCGELPLRLLALLALQGPLSREEAADLLWNGSTRLALQSLRTALSTLRAALQGAPDVLVIGGATLSVNLQALWVDALDSPAEPALLHWWRGPLLAGRTCRGTDRWLEWRHATESRLLEEHLSALYRAAAQQADIRLAKAFVCRARELSAGYGAAPGLPDRKGEYEAGLLGRAQELAALRCARRSVHVKGPRGSGRTSLVRAAFPDAVWFSLPDPSGAPDPGWVSRAVEAGRAVFDDVEQLPDRVWPLARYLDSRGCHVILVSTGPVPPQWHDLPVIEVGAVGAETLIRLAATLAPAWSAAELPVLTQLTAGLPGRAARLLRPGAATLRALLRARLEQFSEDALRVLWVSEGPAAGEVDRLCVQCGLEREPLRRAVATLTDAGLWADGRAAHPLVSDVAGELLPWWTRQVLHPDVARAGHAP